MSEPDLQQARSLRREIQTFLQRFGLHQQHETPCGQPLTVSHAHALMRLLDAERGLRISDLGAHLNIDKSNVSRLCARMEQDGHVERRPCPDDGRAKRLWLTEEGRELAVRVDEASLQRFSQLAEAVEGQQMLPIIEAITTLNDALAKTFPEDN